MGQLKAFFRACATEHDFGYSMSKHSYNLKKNLSTLDV